MNCCLNEWGVSEGKCEVPTSTQSDSGAETNASQNTPCQCAGTGRPVARKTVLLMLKPELLDQATAQTYRFCASPDCAVVYFDDEGHPRFTIDDLRVRVGVKMKSDPIPICYCFGFEESDLRDEMARTGASTIPSRIKKLIKEGMCACEEFNPAGVCCLGEVNLAANRVASELQIASGGLK